MKGLLVPILSFAVLALAGAPLAAFADTVSTDGSAPVVDPGAPAADLSAPSAEPLMLASAAAGPGSVTFSKTCQGPNGAAPAPGQTDTCQVSARGMLAAGSRIVITLNSPQGSMVACGNGSPSGLSQCTYVMTSNTSFYSDSERFMVATTAAPGTLVTQSGQVCGSARGCSPAAHVAVSGSGDRVAGAIGPPPPPPPPPPPGPPFVTKSCAGPNNGGTVYAGQQDLCTVSAAPGDTFRAGNRITVSPASPAGVTVAACSGVAGRTVAVNEGAGNVASNPTPGYACTFTVQSGATINPGETLGTELINIPATAVPGSPIEQGVRWCSGGSEGICNAVPAQITATGPGATVSIDPPISAQGQPISAAEGQGFSGTVATFSDSDPTGTPSEYRASIDWGDGISTDGTINGWSVSGSHTYAEEGAYTVTVTISDPDTAYNSAQATGSASVVDAALSAQGKTINSTNPFSGTVATFTDSDPNGTTADYSATVDWGDGTTTPALIGQGSDGFEVNGTHSYANLGPYTVTTHVCDAGGACADASSNLLVFAYTTGGNFVIGDGNAAIGSAVTFWGAQWSANNTLSSGSAPADFKGFADKPNGPVSCGTGWSASPGNSSHPPDSVPTYTAVIVTSNASQDGPRTSGDSPQVVIVKTDPGYQADPGHAGTGTVVAVLCP